jgi:hypothetical protein
VVRDRRGLRELLVPWEIRGQLVPPDLLDHRGRVVEMVAVRRDHRDLPVPSALLALPALPDPRVILGFQVPKVLLDQQVLREQGGRMDHLGRLVRSGRKAYLGQRVPRVPRARRDRLVRRDRPDQREQLDQREQ